MRFGEMFEHQTKLGEPVRVGSVVVTPQSRSLTVRWPRGGWVWNRPVAVLVERDGKTERIPVVDITRILQLGMLGLSAGLLLLSLVWLVRERSKKRGSRKKRVLSGGC